MYVVVKKPINGKVKSNAIGMFIAIFNSFSEPRFPSSNSSMELRLWRI